MNLHAGRSADGVELVDRARADPVRAGGRPGRRDPGSLRARLRPAGDVARGSLLRHLVQRLPRADDRGRVHARLRVVPPARQRVPAVQPQRRPVPAPDRRALRDAQPAERQRPHAVRRHLLLGEPRPRPLGPPSARHGAHPVDLGVDEDRRRPDADRDARGLAPHLPRRPDVLQRLRLLDGRGAPGPRRAVEGHRPQPRLPALATGAVRAGGRRAERRLPLRRPRGRGRATG